MRSMLLNLTNGQWVGLIEIIIRVVNNLVNLVGREKLLKSCIRV